MKALLSICLVTLMIVIFTFSLVHTQQGTVRPIDVYQENSHQLNIPFTMESEIKQDNQYDPLWIIKIRIPKEYYSKENLDQIFLFFSKKHPNDKERIHLDVYTEPINSESRASALYSTPASFSRECYGPAIPKQCNEWYMYSPNLEKPNEKKRVVLKGTDPYNTKKVLEEWETTNGFFRVHIIAYDLKYLAEPSGTYYAFISPKERFDHWDAFMVFRQDNKIKIPRDNVRFINKYIGYVFMGWIYAVTIDGGNSWSIWNAETDMVNWQCCNYELIKDVHITPEGIGNMSLSLSGTIKYLYTKDYGKHWSVE